MIFEQKAKAKSGLIILSRLRQLVAGPEAIWPSLAALVGAVVVVAWLSPADKVLGDMVKLVYVHGAIIRVAPLVFALAGGLGAAYLALGRAALYEWSQATERTALVLWVLYVLSSVVTMTMAWGGVAWFEPRWVFALQVLVFAPAVHLGGSLMQKRRLSALLNLVVAVTVLSLLYRARLILHPPDPVGTSPSETIKSSYNILVVLWVLIALQLSRGIRHKVDKDIVKLDTIHKDNIVV